MEFPQGSVLGPLLSSFICYPWEISLGNTGLAFTVIADDTQLYISSRPGETHQIEKLMNA